jgi:hypothetical protein
MGKEINEDGDIQAPVVFSDRLRKRDKLGRFQKN